LILISNIKEDIIVNIGIKTKIMYLSVKIGCLNKLYVRGKKYEKNNIKNKRKYLLENLNITFL
tara:strand:+ start:337 stop:525 length:189 start_codon:yes stop_codon:yes gene_type:complete